VNTGSRCEQGAKFLGNSIEVFQRNYWIDRGEGSAQAANNYRRYRLEEARATEVAPGLTEERKLQGELAALGLNHGGAE
jgi:hypothetical protein